MIEASCDFETIYKGHLFRQRGLCHFSVIDHFLNIRNMYLLMSFQVMLWTHYTNYYSELLRELVFGRKEKDGQVSGCEFFFPVQRCLGEMALR